MRFMRTLYYCPHTVVLNCPQPSLAGLKSGWSAGTEARALWWCRSTPAFAIQLRCWTMCIDSPDRRAWRCSRISARRLDSRGIGATTACQRQAVTITGLMEGNLELDQRRPLG